MPTNDPHSDHHCTIGVTKNFQLPGLQGSPRSAGVPHRPGELLSLVNPSFGARE